MIAGHRNRYIYFVRTVGVATRVKQSLIGSYEIAAGKLPEKKGMEATSGSRGIAIGLHFGGVFCDWDIRERGSMLKLSHRNAVMR